MVTNFMNKLIKQIQGELVLGFVLIFYFLFPIFNMVRVFLSIKITFFMLFVFFFLFLFFYFLFYVNKKLYSNCLTFLFNDFLTKNRNFFSFGAFVIKEWPFIFGCFVILSTISILYWRENSHIFWMHAIDCFCVCFRNIFIIPFLGYSTLVTLHLKKKHLLKEDNELTHALPLFANTKSEENLHFYFNFVLWGKCVVDLKPPLDSLRKTSFVSIPGFFLVYFNYFYQKIAFMVFKDFKDNEKYISFYISKLLEKKKLNREKKFLISEIANLIQRESDSLSIEMDQKMSFPIKGFSYFFHEKKFKQILKKSEELYLDSMNLYRCCNNEKDALISQQHLKVLSEKYKDQFQISSLIEPRMKFVEFIHKIFNVFL